LQPRMLMSPTSERAKPARTAFLAAGMITNDTGGTHPESPPEPELDFRSIADSTSLPAACSATHGGGLWLPKRAR
jgi:hypothetical protein